MALQRCPACNIPLTADEMRSARCPSCAAELSSSAGPLPAATIERLGLLHPPPDASAFPTPRGRIRLKWGYLIFGLALVVAAIFLFVMAATGGDQDFSLTRRGQAWE